MKNLFDRVTTPNPPEQPREPGLAFDFQARNQEELELIQDILYDRIPERQYRSTREFFRGGFRRDTDNKD